MKNFMLSAVFGIFGLAMFSGCATMPQTWPNNERNAEYQMVGIQENIGEGLQAGTLSLDESQVYLTTLKGIKTDYANLRGRTVYRDEWDRLFVRLDRLQEDIDRELIKPVRMEEPRNADKINIIQGRIDDGRLSKRLGPREEQEFQSRLDSIRREYFRMTDDGRYPSHEENMDISQRLNWLERDMDRFR